MVVWKLVLQLFYTKFYTCSTEGKGMFDPFEKFVYWVTKVVSWVTGGLVFGVNRALVKSFRESNISPGEQTKIEKIGSG